MAKETEELQKLTVAVLRDLAKKRLGPGTSKLRTKAQLIAALSGESVLSPPAPVSSGPGSSGRKEKKPKQSVPALSKPTRPLPGQEARPRRSHASGHGIGRRSGRAGDHLR